MIEHRQIYVNGKWIDSTATDVIPVVNPATEETIATVARGTAEDVDLAARAAAAAFDEWSRTPVQVRTAVLRRMARLLEARSDDLTDTMVAEVGTPITIARNSQTASAIADLNNFADAMADVRWEERIDESVVHREAAGVVGALCAWNGPLRSVVLKAGASLAAGCTVVLKPAEVAPLTGYVFAEVATEAGLPDGVVNLVSGTGPEVGEAIVLHPAVDMASLTGSVRAGSRVMELASRSVKRVALELGGKSANLICEDADLPAAVASGIEDAFRNAGQVCGGLTRLLVPRSRLAEAEDVAVTTVERFVIGDPLDPATTLGPVVSGVQRERVRGHIQRAIDDGVRLLTGGPEAPEGLDRGYYVRPTVFSGPNSARIAQEEVFGPVVIIIPFTDEEDAISIANDSQYGLAGGVWAADRERARGIARKIRTGRVRINGTAINMKAPHGGFKLSGIGREMGKAGIEDYLEYKAVHG
ncbi:aldehyde dehydrogenase family protein [Actinoplanes sp. NBC_00393]|uniref:aldehyde dehydrogenase family protein n=1 Tax=Actinoplanes sp. NBC_00393 TaxID=2975953 RepID=UPI002E21D993